MAINIEDVRTRAWLDTLYLGETRYDIYETKGRVFKVFCPTVNQILEANRVSRDKTSDEMMFNHYYNWYLCFMCTRSEDFSSFTEELDITDVENIKVIIENLIETTPKLETLTDEDTEELVKYLQDNNMSRYKWNICEKYKKPPSELFCGNTKLTDEQLLWIFINEKIDSDRKYEHMCDDCKERVDNPDGYCWNCGKELETNNWLNMGTSTTTDDDFWLRRSKGTFNKETGEWELPEEKSEEEYMYDFDIVKSDDKELEEDEIFTEDDEDDDAYDEDKPYEYDGNWNEVAHI